MKTMDLTWRKNVVGNSVAVERRFSRGDLVVLTMRKDTTLMTRTKLRRVGNIWTSNDLDAYIQTQEEPCLVIEVLPYSWYVLLVGEHMIEAASCDLRLV